MPWPYPLFLPSRRSPLDGSRHTHRAKLHRGYLIKVGYLFGKGVVHLGVYFELFQQKVIDIDPFYDFGFGIYKRVGLVFQSRAHNCLG